MTNPLISTFREWLDKSGRSVLTVASYVADVKKYIAFLEAHEIEGSVTINRYLFNRFKEHLQAQNQSVATINKAINSMKVFNDFLIEQGIVQEQYVVLKRDRIKIAYGSESEVEVLTQQQIQQILNHLINDTVRNRCIFLMLLYTGIRASELINIKIQDIDRITGQLTVNGKGGKQRTIPLRKEVQEAIDEYLIGERAKSKHVAGPYLFLSQRAEKMHREGVRQMLSDIGDRLGYKIYTHMIRHTFATRLIENGVDLVTVSKLCGHSNVAITSKFYINISNEMKKNAINSI